MRAPNAIELAAELRKLAAEQSVLPMDEQLARLRHDIAVLQYGFLGALQTLEGLVAVIERANAIPAELQKKPLRGVR